MREGSDETGVASTREELLDFLPLSAPCVGEEEAAEVLDVLRSGWLTTGPRAARFEAMLRDYVGAGEVIAVSSCTAALHLSLLALRIGAGDEVITTPITWPATANAIEYTGAKPVFVDIHLDTLNIDGREIEEAITPRTRAIVPMHMAGLPADLGTIHAIAEAHGLAVVEDAAHALGATYKGRAIGSISRYTCFSFAPTKSVTTGEGGAIAVVDAEQAHLIRTLTKNGMTRDSWSRWSLRGTPQPECVVLGFKYNMPDLCAALGIPQLGRLQARIARRRSLVESYRRELADVPELRLLPAADDAGHAHHLFVVLLMAPFVTRDELVASLEQSNIGCGVHYRGLHLQPFYRDKYGLRPGDLPQASFASERVLSLHLYSELTDGDVHRVATTMKNLLSERHRRGSTITERSEAGEARRRRQEPLDEVTDRTPMLILHHPSGTSQRIAFRLEARLAEASRPAKVVCIGDGDHIPDDADAAAWIFPILGDDRIPGVVEGWMTDPSLGHTHHHLCITGDFQPKDVIDNPVAAEAQRLLRAAGSRPASDPLLIDTPIDDDALAPLVDEWIQRLLAGDGSASVPVRMDGPHERPDQSRARVNAIADPRLRTIISMLREPPHFSLNSDGKCISLSLIDHSRYPRSLMQGLSPRQLQALLSAVEEMTELESLGLGFANLEELSIRPPDSLRALDLRGNSFRNFDFLAGHPNVASLNLAACDLSAPPEEVATLPRLHTLILAKNRISAIPDWLTYLENLERVTFYRNQLTALWGPAPGLTNVRLLNLGANPLAEFEDSLAGARILEVLGLRMLGLTAVPRVLYELPNLQFVDLSKNPVFHSAELTHPRITFMDHMPRWQWDK